MKSDLGFVNSHVWVFVGLIFWNLFIGVCTGTYVFYQRFLVFRKKDLYFIITQKLTFMKSGGFQVKSTQNLIKSDVSTKTLQFGRCMEGVMTLDFMTSRVIAPLLHSSNWIILVETFAFIRFWVDFRWNLLDFTWNPLDFMRISCEIERPTCKEL